MLTRGTKSEISYFKLWLRKTKLMQDDELVIARNRGHFAPVINCQRNLIFKMADKDYRSQGKRIPYDILNNLSSVDLFYEEKGKKKTSSKKILGVYQAERLIAKIHTAEKPAA